MKKLIIIFIQLVFVYGINAQDNFFPLKVGNKFYYSVSSSPVPCIIVRIEKDTIAEGRKYFYCSGFPNYTDGWWRVDPITGSLYIFDPSNSAYPTYYKEKLIDSLRAGQGINVEIFGINSISKSFIISISIPFPQGRIEITKKYSSKFGLYNHSYHVLGSYNREHKLIGCVIDGIMYGDTNTVGIVNYTGQIPDKYSLSQNYPNPFNPSTIINYQLTINSFVTLKIFDLLGKEVAALVNEKQNAGSYAVDFNSSDFNLPSGIYFYTLNAGEFKETRKMVLIK